MKSIRAMCVVAGAGLLLPVLLVAQEAPVVQIPSQPPSDEYSLTPDSLPNAAVPHGHEFNIEISHSSIFPETTRSISVYVPAEYKGDKAACVYVGLDGLGFNAPTVFDNLIAKHEMPVTIAIGVSPGTVASEDGKTNPRFDRSFEFDSRSDRLARFLLEEVFPAVEAHAAQDGQKILLSKNPNDRAIGGGSTGGIGAFTVAWENPEEFRRVFSAIGTYVGMRGGEDYYVLVRKTEPKPIRIFMQDGINDEWPGGPEMGDWWMSNQTMERALAFAGYAVNHVWGAGTHNGAQASAVFPAAMRWLWRDYPAPVQAQAPGNPILKTVLKPGEDWRLVADCPAASSITTNAQGNLIYWNGKAIKKLEVDRKTNPNSCNRSEKSLDEQVAVGPKGEIYLADKAERAILSTSLDSGERKIIARDVDINYLTVRNNGDIYFATSKATGELWLVRADKTKVMVASGLKNPSGIAFSPDGLWLFVAQSNSRFAYSYRVKVDGRLDAGEPFYDLYVPAWADDSGAGSVWMDTTGLAYVATKAGVQVLERNGRVAAILPLPDGASAKSICFGGEAFQTLYVSAGGKIYARSLKATGAPAWNPPIALPPWGAG